MVRIITYKLLLTNRNLYKAFFSMALSHHPECDVYSDHSFKIGNIRVCKSCFTASTSAAIFTPVLILTPLIDLFKSFTTSMVILMVFSPFVLVYLLGRGNDNLRMISRILFGLFALFLLVSAFSVEELQFKILYLAVIIIGVIIVFKRRTVKMTGICRKCRYNSEFSSCPGFTSLQLLVEETANGLKERQIQLEST